MTRRQTLLLGAVIGLGFGDVADLVLVLVGGRTAWLLVARWVAAQTDAFARSAGIAVWHD